MTFAACGDDSGSSEPAALTVVASEPAAGEYAFDMPAEMEGGTVTITLDNSGAAEAHEIGFVQVEEGTDPQAFVDEVLASEEGAPIPDFVLAAPGGVGGAAPGATRSATVEFEDGTYVYFCTFGEEVSHYDGGMLGEVTVSGSASSAELPESTGTITASEYQFATEGLTTGEQTIEFTNDGEQFHHLIAAPMTEGATLEDVNAFFASEEPPEGPPPVDFEAAQDLAVIGPGTSNVTNLNLEAGSYAFVCFITDREGGPPHVAKGMITQVDIS
jgi:plastocyanin